MERQWKETCSLIYSTILAFAWTDWGILQTNTKLVSKLRFEPRISWIWNNTWPHHLVLDNRGNFMLWLHFVWKQSAVKKFEDQSNCRKLLNQELYDLFLSCRIVLVYESEKKLIRNAGKKLWSLIFKLII